MALARDGSSASLFSANVAGTLRMIAYLGLACVLMVADRQFGLLATVRYGTSVIIEPLFGLAALPARLAHRLGDSMADRRTLEHENAQLREELMLTRAQLNRTRILARQSQHLQQLLDVQHSLGLQVQLARLIGVDLGPYRHRVMINAGAAENVHVGMTVIDSSGVMGQVVEVLRHTAQVMLISDPNHAIPVVDERTGLRSVAYGTGRGDRLVLPSISLSADMRVGDNLLTSGLGGRFPAGFPVGRVTHVGTDADGMFKVVEVIPSADLERTSEVLLLRDQAAPVGPPAPVASVGPPQASVPADVGKLATARAGAPGP